MLHSTNSACTYLYNWKENNCTLISLIGFSGSNGTAFCSCFSKHAIKERTISFALRFNGLCLLSQKLKKIVEDLAIVMQNISANNIRPEIAYPRTLAQEFERNHQNSSLISSRGSFVVAANQDGCKLPLANRSLATSDICQPSHNASKNHPHRQSGRWWNRPSLTGVIRNFQCNRSPSGRSNDKRNCWVFHFPRRILSVSAGRSRCV